MSFKRQALLTPEVEEQLKQDFLPLWRSGFSGSDIAEKLQLGVEGSPYEKVKPNYVYFYRQKFKFPIRRKPSFGLGEQRYKVAPEDLGLVSTEEFIEALNEKLYQNSFFARRARSFLLILFFTPLRSSEIYERTIDDFKITKFKVKISLHRKKKNHKPTDKKEPISILREFPLVEEVVDWLQGEEWQTSNNPDNRPWNICRETARNYVKEVFPDGYPHWFRFRFLTSGANNPETSMAELKAKSRLTLPALERYIMATEKLADEFDKRELERLKKKGLVK